MNRWKILFQQTLMISTGVLFLIGINGLVSYLTGTDFCFEWYYPFSIILLGLLCSPLTWLFILNGVFKKHFIWNLILHFLSIWVIVVVIGWIFHWYSTLKQILQLSVQAIVVYIFVWVATLWILRTEDKKINQVLKDIQDKE